jgi:hypothetical protein
MNNKTDYSSSSFSSPGQWRRTTRSHPCPICKRFGDCSFSEDGSVIACRKVEQGAFKSDADKNGRYVYLHRLDAISSSASLPPPVPAANVLLADAEILHAVYSAMLANLSLSQAHRSNLQNRGLNDSEIDHRGYRTLPKEGRSRLARELHERFGNEIMRVPGFCRREGDRGRYLSIAGSIGLLIPVRDVIGRIVAIKIRKDEGEPRYSAMSSVKYAGAGPGAPAHVPKGINAPCKVVRLTEGELKADVAFSWSNLPTISVAGVGTWRPAVAILKALGCEIVRLAFDGDMRTNPAVARALDTCARGLIDEGFIVEFERWPENFKGIDDALSAGGIVEVVAAAEARQVIADVVTAATGETDPSVNRGDAHEGEDELPEPVQEEDNELDWVEFPINALPPIIGNFAIEYGKALTIKPAAMALFALTTVAAAIGTSRVIRLNETWVEPSNVFANLICEASVRKSAALEAAVKPTTEWNSKLLKEYKDARAEFNEQFEQYLARIAKNNGEKSTDTLLCKPIEPKKRRATAMDITVETFIREQAINPRNLFLPLDENRLFFSSLGRYAKSGGGSDESFWLSAFNAKSWDYDRKTGDETHLHIDRLSVCLCGGIQPKIWFKIACDAMFESGMIGRILLMWPPKVRYTGYEPPNRSTTGLYHQLVNAVQQLDYEATLSSDWKPTEMCLTGDAKKIWEGWLLKWRDRQYSASGDMAAMLGKMEAYCARFALIYATCDRAFGSLTNAEVVEVDHMRNAITTAEWFANEAERIYRKGRMDPVAFEQDQLLQQIRERGGSISAHDLHYSNRPTWQSTDKARQALEALAKQNGPLEKGKRGRYFIKKKRPH